MATTIDEYLADLPSAHKAALELLRTRILHFLPDAEECISYGLPGFKLGKVVIGFGAARNHLSIYPHSSTITQKLAEELTPWKTSKGAIQFQPDTPLPDTLLQKIIAERLREIEDDV